MIVIMLEQLKTERSGSPSRVHFWTDRRGFIFPQAWVPRPSTLWVESSAQ
jgi:hypothetical protein